MKRAIYIGRFQGFHLGHLDVCKFIDAAPDIDALGIVLGSTQYDRDHKSPVTPWALNPFTVAERTAMIEAALAGQLTKPWSIHPVPDFHDWPRWHAAVVASAPPFQVLYTADRDEAVFFRARGTEVRRFPRVRDFHAGAIRLWMAKGEPWRHAVPEPVAELLVGIDAPARLRELFARDQEVARA